MGSTLRNTPWPCLAAAKAVDTDTVVPSTPRYMENRRDSNSATPCVTNSPSSESVGNSERHRSERLDDDRMATDESTIRMLEWTLTRTPSCSMYPVNTWS